MLEEDGSLFVIKKRVIMFEQWHKLQDYIRTFA